MPAQLAAEQTNTVGRPAVVASRSPSMNIGMVFEDDGTTSNVAKQKCGRNLFPSVG